MRKFWYWMCCLVLLMLPVQAWAANSCTVYFDEQELAFAWQGDGRTYLPMRVVFEQCGAVVEWEYGTRTISAVRPDGAVLTMQIGRNTAVLEHNGQRQELMMDATPYVYQGQTCVPVRFVAEAMLCQVDWRDGAVYIEPQFALSTGTSLEMFWREWDKNFDTLYFVDYSNGGLYEFDIRQRTSRYLMDMPLDGFDFGADTCRINMLLLQKTSAENYLVTAEIYDCRLSPVRCTYQYFWLDGADPNNLVMVEYKENSYNCPWLVDGDTVCFIGDDYVAMINDAADEIRFYGMRRPDACGYPWWTDGQHILLGNGGSDEDYFEYSTQWALADLASGEARDLMGILLSDENKSRLEELADLDERYDGDMAAYWSKLGIGHHSPRPGLEFIGAEAGALHFRLYAFFPREAVENWPYIDIKVPLN